MDLLLFVPCTPSDAHEFTSSTFWKKTQGFQPVSLLHVTFPRTSLCPPSTPFSLQLLSFSSCFSSPPIEFLPFFDCDVMPRFHGTRAPLTDSASQSLLNPGRAEGDHGADKVADKSAKKGTDKAADKASPPSSSRRGGRHWHKHHVEMGWGSRHATLLRVSALLLLTTIYFIATYFLEFGNIRFAFFCNLPFPISFFFFFPGSFVSFYVSLVAKARTFFCQRRGRLSCSSTCPSTARLLWSRVDGVAHGCADDFPCCPCSLSFEHMHGKTFSLSFLFLSLFSFFLALVLSICLSVSLALLLSRSVSFSLSSQR
jgi:hypothetical protein